MAMAWLHTAAPVRALDARPGILPGSRRTAAPVSENPGLATFNLFVKNRRRYGGYVVHVGVVLAAIGIAGSSFYQTETQQNLNPGQSVSLGSYAVRFEGLKMTAADNRQVVVAPVDVFENGVQIGTLTPEKDYYPASQQWQTQVSVRSTLREDLYLILAGWGDDQSATIKVIINPLVAWLWIGFGVFIGGTVIAMWPDHVKRGCLRACE